MSFVDPSLEHEEDFADDEELIEGEFEAAEPVSDMDRAKAMGWKPLPADPRNIQPHEYRGDPRRWTDHMTFIAHGEEELPILRDQNRRMSEKLARLEPEVQGLRTRSAEQDAAIRHVTALAQRADARGYERAKAELEERRREAVRGGDEETFDLVQEQLDALETAHADVVAPPPADPASPPSNEPPPMAPEITAFIAAHAWFRNDPRLRTAMISMHNIVIGEEPEWPVQDQLDEALERMTKAFPEVAAAEGHAPVPPRDPAPAPQRRRAAPSLAPSAPAPPRRPGASPFDRIADPTERAEARAAFVSMKRADPGFTEAEYMKIYDDPHIDVVDLRKQRKAAP